MQWWENISLLGGLSAASVLFVINFALKKLMYKSKWFQYFMQEKPEILIHDGKIDFKALSKLNITSDELNEAIREHGIEHFSDVKPAILEIDGNISIISGDKTIRQTHYQRLKRSKKVIG